MNQVCIQTTEFKNIPQGTVTKGFRIYDNEGCHYDNTWETIPENDLDVLTMVAQGHTIHDPISDMLDFVAENELPIIINDERYEWEQIKDILT